MSTRITIEHNGAGWAQIFTSDAMKQLVDSAGERIAAEAGDHFSYSPATKNRFTVAGFVSGDDEGNILEATDKVLTRAVHS